jgi:hypothetical protein
MLAVGHALQREERCEILAVDPESTSTKKFEIYGISRSVMPKRPVAILEPCVYFGIMPPTEGKLNLSRKILNRPIRALKQPAMSDK